MPNADVGYVHDIDSSESVPDDSDPVNVQNEPDFGLFCTFMTFSHNRSRFQTANDDPICVKVLMKLVRLKYDVISFAMQALLSSQQTRDDYREVLEYTVLYLGGDWLLHHVGYKLWFLER